jgi:cellulose synthase/poly-beta-1,6-N-acetylglucosamine synthase-like glycosyltransferase
VQVHSSLPWRASLFSPAETIDMWASIIFTAAAVLFGGMVVSGLWHLRWVHRLPALKNCALPADDRIRCSVIIAARDEEARVEQTIRRLLRQEAAEIEVILVDDRSADRTAAIVHALGLEDYRVRLVRVDVLPEGWLGKCHACSLGAKAARGEWLLFTDADCWIGPDVIARAFAVARRDGADHVALTPGIDSETFAAHAWHLMFLISFLGWIAGVNRTDAERISAWERSTWYVPPPIENAAGMKLCGSRFLTTSDWDCSSVVVAKGRERSLAPRMWNAIGARVCRK